MDRPFILCDKRLSFRGCLPNNRGIEKGVERRAIGAIHSGESLQPER
jgi:hypothetical protein